MAKFTRKRGKPRKNTQMGKDGLNNKSTYKTMTTKKKKMPGCKLIGPLLKEDLKAKLEHDKKMFDSTYVKVYNDISQECLPHEIVYIKKFGCHITLNQQNLKFLLDDKMMNKEVYVELERANFETEIKQSKEDKVISVNSNIRTFVKPVNKRKKMRASGRSPKENNVISMKTEDVNRSIKESPPANQQKIIHSPISPRKNVSPIATRKNSPMSLRKNRSSPNKSKVNVTPVLRKSPKVATIEKNVNTGSLKKVMSGFKKADVVSSTALKNSPRRSPRRRRGRPKKLSSANKNKNTSIGMKSPCKNSSARKNLSDKFSESKENNRDNTDMNEPVENVTKIVQRIIRSKETENEWIVEDISKLSKKKSVKPMPASKRKRLIQSREETVKSSEVNTTSSKKKYGTRGRLNRKNEKNISIEISDTDDEAIEDIDEHISLNMDRDNIERSLQPTPLLPLNSESDEEMANSPEPERDINKILERSRRPSKSKKRNSLDTSLLERRSLQSEFSDNDSEDNVESIHITNISSDDESIKCSLEKNPSAMLPMNIEEGTEVHNSDSEIEEMELIENNEDIVESEDIVEMENIVESDDIGKELEEAIEKDDNVNGEESDEEGFVEHDTQITDQENVHRSCNDIEDPQNEDPEDHQNAKKTEESVGSSQECSEYFIENHDLDETQSSTKEVARDENKIKVEAGAPQELVSEENEIEESLDCISGNIDENKTPNSKNSKKKEKRKPGLPFKIRFNKKFKYPQGKTCPICFTDTDSNVNYEIHMLSHIQHRKPVIKLYRFRLPNHLIITNKNCDKYLKPRIVSDTLEEMRNLVCKYSPKAAQSLGKESNFNITDLEDTLCNNNQTIMNEVMEELEEQNSTESIEPNVSIYTDDETNNVDDIGSKESDAEEMEDGMLKKTECQINDGEQDVSKLYEGNDVKSVDENEGDSNEEEEEADECVAVEEKEENECEAIGRVEENVDSEDNTSAVLENIDEDEDSIGSNSTDIIKSCQTVCTSKEYDSDCTDIIDNLDEVAKDNCINGSNTKDQLQISDEDESMPENEEDKCDEANCEDEKSNDNCVDGEERDGSVSVEKDKNESLDEPRKYENLIAEEMALEENYKGSDEEDENISADKKGSSDNRDISQSTIEKALQEENNSESSEDMFTGIINKQTEVQTVLTIDDVDNGKAGLTVDSEESGVSPVKIQQNTNNKIETAETREEESENDLEEDSLETKVQQTRNYKGEAGETSHTSDDDCIVNNDTLQKEECSDESKSEKDVLGNNSIKEYKNGGQLGKYDVKLKKEESSDESDSECEDVEDQEALSDMYNKTGNNGLKIKKENKADSSDDSEENDNENEFDQKPLFKNEILNVEHTEEETPKIITEIKTVNDNEIKMDLKVSNVTEEEILISEDEMENDCSIDLEKVQTIEIKRSEKMNDKEKEVDNKIEENSNELSCCEHKANDENFTDLQVSSAPNDKFNSKSATDITKYDKLEADKSEGLNVLDTSKTNQEEELSEDECEMISILRNIEGALENCEVKNKETNIVKTLNTEMTDIDLVNILSGDETLASSSQKRKRTDSIGSKYESQCKRVRFSKEKSVKSDDNSVCIENVEFDEEDTSI